MNRIVLLAAIALAGCVTPGRSASLGLDQVGMVDGLRVRPIEVVEDSRCPINVTCVWAGRLVVRTEIRGGNQREIRDFELHQPQAVAGGRLVLVEAAPGRLADQPIRPGDYRFTFAFERGL